MKKEQTTEEVVNDWEMFAIGRRPIFLRFERLVFITGR